MADSQVPPAGAAGEGGGVDSPGGGGGEQAGGGGGGHVPDAVPVKKRRRWVWVVGGIVVGLLLLVLLAPTIASMGWVRAIIVSQINNSLDGDVQISDWSLGWFSGVDVSGLRVTQDGGQIAEMKRLRTQLTLLDAVRGKFHLGKTKVEGLDVLVKIYPDGRTNFHRLLKLEKESKEPLKVPDVSGEIEAEVRGTIARDGRQPILIDSSAVKATIKDINQAIAHQADLAVRVGGGSGGKVRAGGSLKLFENNTLDLGKMSADEKVTIEGVDLAGLATLMGPGAGIEKIEGKANGTITAKAMGADQVVVAGDVVCEGVAVGGKALAGDTYRSGRVEVKIPETSFNGATGQIRTGAAGNPITVRTDQGVASVVVDATRGALVNLAENRAPGAAGRVMVSTDFDFAKLAEQLPHLLRIKEGIKPVSGKMKQATEIVLAADKATFKTVVDLTELTAVDAKGAKIEAKPIHLSIGAASLGGGGVVPDLRDIGLELKSGFATVSGKGESLAKLNVEGKANLADLQREAGQFVKFGDLQMAGEARFNVTANGQLAKEDDEAAVEGVVTLTGVRVSEGAATKVDEPWIEANLKGKLVRGKGEFVKALRGGVVTVRTGNAQKPTVDVVASGEVGMAGKTVLVPSFELTRCNVDAAVQKEAAWVGEMLKAKGWSVPRGSVSVTASGSWDGTTAGIKSLKAAATNVTVEEKQADGTMAAVLSGYGTVLDVAGTVRREGEGFEAKLSKLSLSDGGKLASVQKVGDGELVMKLPTQGVAALDMVQKATVVVELPDLGRAAKVMEGIMGGQKKEQAAAGPMVLKSGSLKIAARVARSERGVALNVDELSGKGIAIERGKGRFGPKDLALKLVAAVVADTSDPAKPLKEQIKEIQITELGGDAGIAQVALVEPIVVKGIGGTLVASGAVKVAGDLRQASDLMEALAGEDPGTAYAYSGAYTVVQRVKTDGPVISLAGDVGIDDFAVGNVRRPRFAEKAVRAAEEITIDQKAKVISIRKLMLDMVDSKALGLAVSGSIGDYTGARTLENMKVLVSYDAAKLLEIARPMLSPEQQERLKDLKLAGVVRDREIVVGGKYPAAEAAVGRRGRVSDPINFVKASGVLGFDRVEYQGMVGEFKEIPFVLSEGVARLVYADRTGGKELPAPYPLNGGKMDLGGLEVAFGGAELRVNSPRKDYKLLENVAINREFVEKYLGKLNPLFTVPKKAKGVINVTVNDLVQLPLGQSLVKPTRREVGRAKLTFSVTDLELDSLVMGLLAKQLQLKLNPDGTLPGNIRDGVVEIEGGVAKSNMGLDLGGQVIAMRNTEVSLADERIRSMEMVIPKAMLSQLLLKQIPAPQRGLIKDQIVVPVKGTLSKAEFDIFGAAIKSVDVLSPLQQLLKGVEGGKKEKAR